MADFGTRVVVVCVGGAVASAAGAGWLAGSGMAVGVLVGATVAVLNFRWLVRSVAALREEAPRGRGRSVALVALRHLLSFAALALPVAAGAAHPVGLGVGLTVLPVALTAVGLWVAREEA